jgi:hypothetical protein
MVTVSYPPSELADLATGSALGSIGEATAILRGDLARIETALRELTPDAAELAPCLAARLNVAARLIHNAVDALTSDGW